MQASPCLLCFEVFHYGEGLPLLSIFFSVFAIDTSRYWLASGTWRRGSLLSFWTWCPQVDRSMAVFEVPLTLSSRNCSWKPVGQDHLVHLCLLVSAHNSQVWIHCPPSSGRACWRCLKQSCSKCGKPHSRPSLYSEIFRPRGKDHCTRRFTMVFLFWLLVGKVFPLQWNYSWCPMFCTMSTISIKHSRAMFTVQISWINAQLCNFSICLSRSISVS